MYKWYQVLIQNLDVNVDGNLNKDLDENLPWLTQKTEDPKSNKGNITFSPHTVNVIELNCKVIKKVATPLPISTLTPPFQVYPPLSSKKFRTPPPNDSILGRSYPSSPLIIRTGGSNYDFIVQALT